MVAITDRPHTAVISYQATGTKDAEGTYTPGTETSISISCSIQPNRGSQVSGPNGDLIHYSYDIYSDPISQAGSIPDGAKITFLGKEYTILELFAYQLHVEIKV